MAITINSRARAAKPAIAVRLQVYTVLRTGFLAGTHYNAGDKLSLSDRGAQYLVHNRQIALVTEPAVPAIIAPTPAPAATPAAPAATPAAAPTAQVKTDGTIAGN